MSLATIPYHAFDASTRHAPRFSRWRDGAARYRPAARRLAFAFGLTAALFLGAMTLIAVAGYRTTARGADVMLVLGNKVHRDGRPSERLERRLERAVELYNAGFAPTVIVSGGIAGGADEAVAMRAYLVAHGVPAAAIVADSAGADTYCSARFTARYLEEHGLRRVLVVSQFYHLPRAALALDRFGVPDISAARAHHFGWHSDLRGLAREVPACVYYYFRGY